MNYIENLFSLKNKIALVTGAARGNGKAIAEALLRAGATVILVDILEKELAKTTKNFTSKYNLKAIAYPCNITNIIEIQKMKKFVFNRYKKIDILVNNAGVSFSHDLFDYSENLWDKTYKVNLKSVFDLSREFAILMRKRRKGIIINITSINSEVAFPNNPAYVTFKGALKQLGKSLAYDLSQYGIRVNNVGPGYFKTDMTKKSWEVPQLNKQRKDRTMLGRWGKPSDLSGIIILLASDASSYITGQDFYIDGGWLAKGL